MTYQKIPVLCVTWHMKLHYRLMLTSFFLFCIYLHPQVRGSCLEENANYWRKYITIYGFKNYINIFHLSFSLNIYSWRVHLSSFHILSGITRFLNMGAFSFHWFWMQPSYKSRYVEKWATYKPNGNYVLLDTGFRWSPLQVIFSKMKVIWLSNCSNMYWRRITLYGSRFNLPFHVSCKNFRLLDTEVQRKTYWLNRTTGLKEHVSLSLGEALQFNWLCL